MPISLQYRLAICLYQLGRGDYLVHNRRIVGLQTIHVIVKEVCKAIVKNLWKKAVTNHFLTSEQEFTEAMVDMDQLWLLGVGEQWMVATSQFSIHQVERKLEKSTITLKTFSLLL